MPADNVTERIKAKALVNKLASGDEAASIIQKAAKIGISGNIPALDEAIIKNAKEGTDFALTVWSGAVGLPADIMLGGAGVIARRVGQQSLLRKSINEGKVAYSDLPLGSLYQTMRAGELGALDIAIVTATAITEDGNIIPSLVVADMPNFVDMAAKVIVGIDMCCPPEIEGLHDIFLPKNPPHRGNIPIYKTSDRIGTKYIPLDASKISHIIPVQGGISFPKQQADDISIKIGKNVVKFLQDQVAGGWLPSNLLPIEIGVGGASAAILDELVTSNFDNLEFYTAIVGDGILNLIDRRKVRAASGTALMLSDENLKKFLNDIESYKEYIVLRPLEISDSPEVAARLGIIAINGAIEVDIYGFANCTHIAGGRVINGIGGLGDFASNSFISIVMLPSVAKNGAISGVVPMVSHVSLTEHNVDIVVTEQGVADLRGLCPLEKAEIIIQQCSHPYYRPLLMDYFTRASQKLGGHQPHLLDEALSFHQRLFTKGTMKV